MVLLCSFLDHILAMWTKRFDWAKRDLSLLVCQMIIPIVILIAVLAAVQLDAAACVLPRNFSLF